MNIAKAWTAGLAAWLGKYLVDLIELGISTDIPADVEAGIIGLLVAVLAWAVPNRERAS